VSKVNRSRALGGRLGARLGALCLALSLLCFSESAVAEGWHERYQRAQEALIRGDDTAAATEFDALAVTAKTPEDRKVAEEMAKVARAKASLAARKPVVGHIRTSDELSLLYTTAFVYGFGTSAWLALQIEPETFAGAVLPFVVLTTAAVGGVAVADDYRPFRLGVPQSIAAGMFLGVGEGAWLVGYQHAVAMRRGDDSHWRSATVSTMLWTGATLGGFVGGAVGAWREPTPGRVSFAASASLWPGFVASMGASALQPTRELRSETAFLAGGAAYNLGLATAILIGPDLNPSVARIRFVDLGGLAGGLLGVSSYLLAAGSGNTSRGGLGAAALGATAGLGLAWWATDEMEPDVRRAVPDTNPLAGLRPTFTPLERGWTVGVAGSL
jgi:hypothetical protein